MDYAFNLEGVHECFDRNSIRDRWMEGNPLCVSR